MEVPLPIEILFELGRALSGGKMCRLFATLAVFSLIGTISGQQIPPDDCLMKCTNEHYRKSPRADMGKIMNIKTVKLGNTTVTCPDVQKNQTEQMDAACAGLRELRQCTDACPDTPIKAMTMSAFKSLQFICIDRLDDMKKNMPCLSEICPDVQAQCTPKCGAIDASTQKIIQVLARVQGRPPAAAPAGANVSQPAAQPVDVDMDTITKSIAEACRTMNCFMSCGETPIKKQCGNDAFVLQRDVTWNGFSQLAQSMSSIGIQTPWPEECKGLASAASAGTPAPGAGMTQAVKETVGGDVHSETSPAPSGEPKTGKTKGPTADESKKCDKPPCDASATIIPSILLLIISLLFVSRRDI